MFSVDWEPLRGKTVKVYSVQPAQSPTLETGSREAQFRKGTVLARIERAFRNRYGHGWRCRRLRFAGWGPGVGDSRLPGTMATRKTSRTGVLASMFARSTGDVQYCGQEAINIFSPITGYIGMPVQPLGFFRVLSRTEKMDRPRSPVYPIPRFHGRNYDSSRSDCRTCARR